MSSEVKPHHFQKGNPGGPGRPKKVDYRAIFEKCVTAQAFYEIIDKAVQDAINGAPATRARARAFVVSFVLSPIPKTVNVVHAETLQADTNVHAVVPDSDVADEGFMDLIDACQNAEELRIAMRINERREANKQKRLQHSCGTFESTGHDCDNLPTR